MRRERRGGERGKRCSLASQPRLASRLAAWPFLVPCPRLPRLALPACLPACLRLTRRHPALRPNYGGLVTQARDDVSAAPRQRRQWAGPTTTTTTTARSGINCRCCRRVPVDSRLRRIPSGPIRKALRRLYSTKSSL